MTTPAVTLFAAIVHAPITGVQRRWPNTYHAVEIEGLPSATWETARTARSVCGLRVALIASDEGMPVLWPVPHRLPDGRTRCRECWTATGSKRPRTRLRAA